MKPFTERQRVLLDLIDKATKPSGDGERLCYFVPISGRSGNWSEVLKGFTRVTVLRKFERGGLTENARSPVNPYCCRITLKGREALNDPDSIP